MHPLLFIPSSNSPFAADTTKKLQSAYDAPVIMFFKKFLCPGTSIIVKLNLEVVNFYRDKSTVIPLSLSVFNLSKIQANLNFIFLAQ